MAWRLPDVDTETLYALGDVIEDWCEPVENDRNADPGNVETAKLLRAFEAKMPKPQTHHV